MARNRFLVFLLSFAVAGCSLGSDPSGSLEVSIGDSPVALPAQGAADVTLTLANTGGSPVTVDLCSERIAAGLQEQIDGVWVEAGSNSCGGSARESVVISQGSSLVTSYALTRPGTFRLRIPFIGTNGFAEVTTPSFQATR